MAKRTYVLLMRADQMGALSVLATGSGGASRQKKAITVEALASLSLPLAAVSIF